MIEKKSLCALVQFLLTPMWILVLMVTTGVLVNLDMFAYRFIAGFTFIGTLLLIVFLSNCRCRSLFSSIVYWLVLLLLCFGQVQVLVHVQ